MNKKKSQKEAKIRSIWNFDPCTRVKQSKKEYNRYSLKKELLNKRLEICDICGLLESECLCKDEFEWTQ